MILVQQYLAVLVASIPLLSEFSKLSTKYYILSKVYTGEEV